MRLVVLVSLCWGLFFIGNAEVAFAREDRPTGVFVSIDGLRPDRLQAIYEAGHLTAPKGLGWLFENSLWAERVTPAITTLTAPSHVSTITCSLPSQHGVIANSYLVGGEEVSGFEADIATETLWQAAKRQGLRVLSLAYVGADGLTPEREADAGIGYPSSSLLGERQEIRWKLAELPRASGWRGATRNEAREAVLEIVLNAKTRETRTVNVLVTIERRGGVSYVFDLDKDLTNGVLAELSQDGAAHADLIFVEADPASDKPGRKRRAVAWRLPAPNGEAKLYISKPSYNQAYPESFRQALDDANLIWPDYGVRGDDLSLAFQVEGQSLIDRFLADVGRFALGREAFDVVLFYQPLIDTMGHGHEAELPVPFDPNGTDELTRAYVETFRIVDRNLSRLFEAFPGGEPRVAALMGDHGMDPVSKMVNVARLLPRGALDKVKVTTSGAMTLLYPADGANLDEAHEVGRELADRLVAFRDGPNRVLGAAHARVNLRSGEEWHYGEAVWAFLSGSGYWLTFKPFERDVLLPPDTPGMHGHPAGMPSMATTLLLRGPGVGGGRIERASLLDAFPSFAALMGIQPPRDCVGRSLIGSAP